METRPSSEPLEALPAGQSRDVAAEGDRLQQLCQAIMQTIGRQGSQEDGGLRPDPTLQAEAGRILLPHLEAGMRSLTEALRDDLLVRLANVRQLERLSGLDSDPASLSRMLDREPRPAALPSPFPSEPLRLPAPEMLEPAFQPDSSVSSAPALDTGDSITTSTSTPAAALVDEGVFDLTLAPLDPEPVGDSIQIQEAPPEPSDPEPSVDSAPSEQGQPPSAESMTAERYLRLAAGCCRRGDMEEALAACSRAIRCAPEAFSGYLLRGQIHFLRRELDRAIADFSTAIEIRPDHAEAFLKRGNVFLGLGQHPQAVSDYSTALDLKPGLAAAYLNRALVHARQKAWQEAVADATAVIRLQPHSAGAYFIRGSAQFQQGAPDQALADLNQLLQLDPKNALAYNERGLVQASLGEYDHALADYGKALRLKPRLVLARYNRAIALFQRGELDLALAAFTELTRLVPDNAMAYYQRGLIHCARHHPEQAIPDFTRALELHPQFQEASDRLQQARQLAAPADQQAASGQARTAPEASASDAVSQPDDLIAPAEPAPAFESRVAVEQRPAKPDGKSSQDKEPHGRGQISLVCEECGTLSHIRIDRLSKKFQCRRCQSTYALQPDGNLTRILPPSEAWKARARRAARVLSAAALFLVLFLGGWYGWHGISSARSPASLPSELEPRAETLTRAWLDRDAELVEMLTTPAQEGQVRTWLKSHEFPLPADELNASRTLIKQMKVEVQVLEEKRDSAQLSVEVSTPTTSPVKVVQSWVREGNAWYFQPSPRGKKDKPKSQPAAQR